MEVFRFFSGENLFRDEQYLENLLSNISESPSRTSVKRALNEIVLEHLIKKKPLDNSKNSWHRAYNTCHKDWFYLKILLGHNAWLAVVTLAEQNLKRATRFELTEMVVDMYRIMMLYYGSIAGMGKKYFTCREAVKRWEIVSQAEINAERQYSELVIFSELHKGNNQKIQKEAVKAFECVKQDMQKHQTYSLHL